MDATQSCELIRQNLVRSGLHFFVNESPFSLWITIRKKFISGAATDTTIKNHDTIKHETKVHDDENRHKDLADDYAKLSKAYEALKIDFETEIGEHRDSIDENRKLRAEVLRKGDIISSLKEETQQLKEEFEAVKESHNKVKKELKDKDKEMYNVKKENVKVKEDFEQLNNKYKEFQSTVNKEKK